MNDQTCEKWFATFHDSPRSGRRIEKKKRMPCLPASTGGTYEFQSLCVFRGRDNLRMIPDAVCFYQNELPIYAEKLQSCFEFNIALLLYLLPTKPRQPCLPSYSTYRWVTNRWIQPFTKGICAKVRIMNSTGIRTRLTDFYFQFATRNWNW